MGPPDRQIMVETSDRMWSTGEGNGKPLQYSCLENLMNSMKRQKVRTLKDEFPRSVVAQYEIEVDFFFLEFSCFFYDPTNVTI